MRICKVCKTPINENGYVHEYSFGTTLKLEETHSGVCAEEYKTILEGILESQNDDDEQLLTESLEEMFDGYQVL